VDHFETIRHRTGRIADRRLGDDLAGARFDGSDHRGVERSREDITEAKRIRRRSRRRAGSRRPPAARRIHFLSVLSHELRTPLTPVLMALALLERRADLSPDVMDDW
jgi:signal transduction histidine kinase